MLPKKISGLLIAFLCSTLGFNLNAATLRDPTLPGNTSEKGKVVSGSSSRHLVLNSVVKKDSSAYAVINNQIYTLGERVKGVKIVHIGKDTVSLSDGRKLTMFQAITDLKGQ
ncbi:MSHA biogenesis protein MshK [Shewanella sp. MBTL60-007]|uniref:MSHA biogenesis protein MshK n=1 Tax=Shewanella sp. MBTL60-007 TaxID=2815911 RepID=UPI001BC20F27|nr:MSHA biogenesis protein MshK [Shewanella sp. MBTL60-007]GIU12147.1 MSHA biogenesis protein MshK [Shewanella sp. MBTL60-007]